MDNKKPIFSPVLIGDIVIKEMNIKTTENTGHIYIYKNGYYTSNNSIPIIRKRITEILVDGYKKYKIEDILSYIKDKTLFRIPENTNPSLLCLRNCVFDIETLEKKEFSNQYFFTNKIPVNYDPNQETYKWRKYVETLTSDEDMINTLQEYVGYTLTKNQKAKKLLFIYGNRDSGKSSFFRILTEFYGYDNISTLSLQQICQRFTNAELFGKLANIRADMEYKISPTSVGIIKSLTGDDNITAERKFQDPFSFHNQTKIFLSANGVPTIDPENVDDAFYKRWVPIEFPNRFSKDNKDTDIVSKYTTPEMLSSVLNWALEGLIRLRKNNWIFTFNPNLDQIKEWFTLGVIHNNVENFLQQKCKATLDKFVLKEELYKCYKRWCGENQSPILPDNSFHRKVKNNRIYTVEEFRPRYGDMQFRAWRGIDFLEPQNGGMLEFLGIQPDSLISR